MCTACTLCVCLQVQNVAYRSYTFQHQYISVECFGLLVTAMFCCTCTWVINQNGYLPANARCLRCIVIITTISIATVFGVCSDIVYVACRMSLRRASFLQTQTTACFLQRGVNWGSGRGWISPIFWTAPLTTPAKTPWNASALASYRQSTPAPPPAPFPPPPPLEPSFLTQCPLLFIYLSP